MSKKRPYIACPHCGWGYSREETVYAHRESRQDEFSCTNCGKEVSSHDPRIIPPGGAILPRFKPPCQAGIIGRYANTPDAALASAADRVAARMQAALDGKQ